MISVDDLFNFVRLLRVMKTTRRYTKLGVQPQEDGTISFPEIQTLSTFAELITVFRLRLGWTMKQMASKLGVVRQTVFNWESGFCIPDPPVLEKISSVLFLSDQEKKRLLSVAKPNHRKNHHV